MNIISTLNNCGKENVPFPVYAREGFSVNISMELSSSIINFIIYLASLILNDVILNVNFPVSFNFYFTFGEV